ncbi:unnamed protein product, partial [Soboliphyme baturini]|uniref:Protein Wnt n=1 Tax=Soboliphyme baturini TaxID=241478 RepID=A0A183I8Y5_9BILA
MDGDRRKGCSDNVHYGQKVSKEWTKPSKRKIGKYSKRYAKGYKTMYPQSTRLRNGATDDIDDYNFPMSPKAKMNHHNNRVGRNLIAQVLETKCKCHGVSGSCNLKTCWKVLPPLTRIGHILKNKYSRAAEVRALHDNSARFEFEPVALMGRITSDDLVFIKKSPDYCTEDRRVGSFGTRGRACNASENSYAGCDSMCCGRGHETLKDEMVYNCQCRY